MGSSSFGQSPVSINEAISEICDTGMSQYNFTAGSCQWTDLKFSINKGGTQELLKQIQNGVVKL